jgi:hypothetical protein
MMTRRTTALLLFAALVSLPSIAGPLIGQTGGHIDDLVAHSHPKGEPSTQLTLTGPDGKTLTLSAADFKALPHKSIIVMNGHANAKESYAGVPLTDLLAKVGVPVGKDLKGKAYVMYAVAEGTDHYRVLYSLDEIDGAAHQGDVIVADTLDGAALTTDGAFKLVSSEDKRPARWVRNLTTITVKIAE